MAKLSQHISPVKMLLIGDSGTGKTGALASLALAGYKLRVLDFDKGIESLANIIADKDEKALDNVDVQQLDDRLQVVAGAVIPRGVPDSFQKALALMTHWGPKSHKEAEEYGPPSEWGLDHVLVIDSLTHLGQAAMRYTQAVNSTSGKNPSQPEWGTAQRIIEQMLGLLYSSEFKTNVIITSHITYDRMDDRVDDKGNPIGELKGNPTALGRALPPKIPSYFNHMLLAEKRGSGPTTKRVLTTVPNYVINTKSPIVGVPKELPIETGLATYFDKALNKAKAGGA